VVKPATSAPHISIYGPLLWARALGSSLVLHGVVKLPVCNVTTGSGTVHQFIYEWEVLNDAKLYNTIFIRSTRTKLSIKSTRLFSVGHRPFAIGCALYWHYVCLCLWMTDWPNITSRWAAILRRELEHNRAQEKWWCRRPHVKQTHT